MIHEINNRNLFQFINAQHSWMDALIEYKLGNWFIFIKHTLYLSLMMRNGSPGSLTLIIENDLFKKVKINNYFE